MDNERLVLPPEILYEILANLPVKTLVRFRCVCKSWNSLFSDSSFQQEHYRRRLQQDPVILMASAGWDTLDLSTQDINTGINAGTDMEVTDFSIPFPVRPSSSSVGALQICQGLACVSLSTNIFVCNPATREIISLPPFSGEPNHGVGFGYATSTKEFKVIRFFRSSFSSLTKNYCQIFTLGTSQWREARCPPPDSFSDLSFHAPFFQGAIHFLSDSEYHDADDAIYAFDIESEEYTTIRFPEDYYFAGEEGSVPEWTWQCLNELKGCLCLTSHFETSTHLWLLKDYARGKWVKEYVIDLPVMSFDFVWGEPLAITSDGTLLLKINGEVEYGQLYWYNPGDKTLEETCMEDYTAMMYVESLLPLAF